MPNAVGQEYLPVKLKVTLGTLGRGVTLGQQECVDVIAAFGSCYLEIERLEAEVADLKRPHQDKEYRP
jgi:hypothetical protein